jgi:hypothetical protein
MALVGKARIAGNRCQCSFEFRNCLQARSMQPMNVHRSCSDESDELAGQVHRMDADRGCHLSDGYALAETFTQKFFGLPAWGLVPDRVGRRETSASISNVRPSIAKGEVRRLQNSR